MISVLFEYNGEYEEFSCPEHVSYDDDDDDDDSGRSIKSYLQNGASNLFSIPVEWISLVYPSQNSNETIIENGCIIEIHLNILGGVDFQHREGSKTGSGGLLSDSQAALDRKERLRKLALETIDISKDPYFMRNHLGQFECRLCLTLHPNEGNYLAHTQGKRHQSNLGRRAAMEGKNAMVKSSTVQIAPKRKLVTIGRPGYKVTKARDLITKQRSLAFEIDYAECAENIQPRHRFMSAFEQKIETPDKNYQYLVLACEPYDNIAFKIPSHPIDKGEGKLITNWDERSKKFYIQIFFADHMST